MPRPKSEDPKVAVSLRIAASAMAAWTASGSDWRSRMEAMLSRGPYDDEPENVPAAPTPKPPTTAKAIARPRTELAPAQPAGVTRKLDTGGVVVFVRSAQRAAFLANQKPRK